MGVESGKGGGVPIPRGPGNRIPQAHPFSEYSTMALHMEDHSSFPNQQSGHSLGPQWDGNVTSSTPTYHDQFSGLSPIGPNSPSLWPPQSMDFDLDIKLEPLDDLLGVDDFLPSQTLGLHPADDTLLDDVNLDDLLVPEQFSSPAVEQPNSPLPLAAVHPDEVMGMNRGYCTSGTSNLYASSAAQPVKAESTSLYTLLASSFPPQGGGWRDPLLTSSSLPGQQPINQQVINQLGSIEECPISDQQQQTVSPQHQNQNQSSNSTSALQELLLQSPSTPLSPHSVSSPRGAASPQQEFPMGQSVPRPTSLAAANPLLSARLSSSAPTRNVSLEQAWQRREPRQHLLSTGSLAEEFGGSASSLSTGTATSLLGCSQTKNYYSVLFMDFIYVIIFCFLFKYYFS